MGHLYALDFDGVICDSCGETAISALKVHSLSPSISNGRRKQHKIIKVSDDHVQSTDGFGFKTKL